MTVENAVQKKKVSSTLVLLLSMMFGLFHRDKGEIGITAHIPSWTEMGNFATFWRESTGSKLHYKKKTKRNNCALFFSPSQMKTWKSREVVFLEIGWHKFLHPPIKIARSSKRIRRVLCPLKFNTLHNVQMAEGDHLQVFHHRKFTCGKHLSWLLEISSHIATWYLHDGIQELQITRGDRKDPKMPEKHLFWSLE